jgi:pyruvate,water dikinase
VTNRGGRTCHAAIIARELGIPAVVGCGDATSKIHEGQEVTVSCAEGDTGYVYDGLLPFDQAQIALDSLPKIPVKIMMNVGNPDRAFDFAGIPNRGVGLARPRVHHQPHDRRAPARAARLRPARGRSQGHDPAPDRRLCRPRRVLRREAVRRASARSAAAFAPEPVIVRLSDFKSNEYANLIGGRLYEPAEENPMLGFRGASRYVDESFRPCFELECRAPEARTRRDGSQERLDHGAVRAHAQGGRAGGRLAGRERSQARRGRAQDHHDVRAATNAVLADRYLEHFDGMSIGSNDMTQLTLGLDRDSAIIARLFDERDDAVKAMLHMAIQACRKAGKYVGICGQGPSDHPDLARWLVDEGIESISLNPDTVIETWLFIAGQKID